MTRARSNRASAPRERRAMAANLRATVALLATAVLLLGAPAARADTGDAAGLEDLDLVKLMGLGLSDLVVSGAAKREQSLEEVAAAATVVTIEQIRRHGYRTVADALRAVAGVYVVDDRMVERVGIRGLQLLGDANTRLLVLVDGATINEPWAQFADTGLAIPLHIDEVERIEIIRGPVSSVYGTNAFFGIINIVTRRAAEGVHSYGRVGGGSFGTVSGNAGVSIGGEDHAMRAFASWSQRTGETLRYAGFAVDGERTTTSADGIAALHGGIGGDYHGLRVQLRGGQRLRALPGAPYDSVADGDNHNRDRYLMAEASYARAVLDDDLTLSLRGYANRYASRTDLELEMAGSPSGPQPFASDATSLWYGTELRAVWAALSDGRLDVTGGVAAEWSDTGSAGGMSGDPQLRVDEAFSIASVYTEVTGRPLTWLSFAAGLRHDRNSLFDSRLSPRGALFAHAPSKLYGAKLVYAEGFRNPSILESFYDDGQRYHPSGSELRPESIDAKEALLWVKPLPGLEVRLSGWQWHLVDIIEKRRVYDPTALAQRFQFQNLADLSSTGVELESSYRQTDGWSGFAGASLARVARNEGYEEPINAPAVTLNAGASTPRLFGRAHASVEAQLISRRNTRDKAVEAAPWLGIDAAIHAPSLWGLDVTLGVRNLLGTREEVPAQSDYDRVFEQDGTLRNAVISTLPGTGRELFVRVGYEH
jgi:outer membrane receptor for ferrienterochelin and colicins